MEHKGENLPSVLAEISAETIVYLGSASSFFDIATAGELRDKKYMDKLSKSSKSGFVAKADSAEKNFLRRLRNPPVWAGPKDGQSEAESIKDHLKTVSMWAKRVENGPRYIEAMRKRVRDFIPLEKRKVREVYPRIDGTGVCVIVEGQEEGSFWFIDEKQAGREEAGREN